MIRKIMKNIIKRIERIKMKRKIKKYEPIEEIVDNSNICYDDPTIYIDDDGNYIPWDILEEEKILNEMNLLNISDFEDEQFEKLTGMNPNIYR